MPSETLELDIRARLDAFDLEATVALPLDGITAVFGPSGGGKTTLLRTIAGFENARGHIALRGEPWLDSSRRIDLPPHRRSVGCVFQDARLFGHLPVRGNLLYAARRAQRGGTTFDEVVAAFDLGSLLSRRVAALSGGERQRVALARSLLTNAGLLLLDEPLAALDTNARGTSCHTSKPYPCQCCTSATPSTKLPCWRNAPWCWPKAAYAPSALRRKSWNASTFNPSPAVSKLARWCGREWWHTTRSISSRSWILADNALSCPCRLGWPQATSRGCGIRARGRRPGDGPPAGLEHSQRAFPANSSTWSGMKTRPLPKRWSRSAINVCGRASLALRRTISG